MKATDGQAEKRSRMEKGQGSSSPSHPAPEAEPVPPIKPPNHDDIFTLDPMVNEEGEDNDGKKGKVDSKCDTKEGDSEFSSYENEDKDSYA
ncbi:hypothetical protein HAX54_000985 [Datura stramonium]|uniref:Uncharacterized protein n=1 Tax=Datura stramonium TaxID=4076 RepID=A0ABS8T3Z1_DATST|nr:hypothetical protein [Datura stramonium]